MRAISALFRVCLLALMHRAAALKLLSEPDERGFDCAIVVRGTASLAPGNAYSDQGPAIRDAVIFWAEWVNDTRGGVSIVVGDDDQRTCGIDLWIDDDLSDPAVAVAYYEEYMDEADMVIGPYSSSLAGPAGDVRWAAIACLDVHGVFCFCAKVMGVVCVCCVLCVVCGVRCLVAWQ